jgi:hypothetical protein
LEVGRQSLLGVVAGVEVASDNLLEEGMCLEGMLQGEGIQHRQEDRLEEGPSAALPSESDCTVVVIEVVAEVVVLIDKD